jgi:hypothetical protein
METGFNAMGHPVPANRLQKGYKTIKEILTDVDNETAMSIAQRCRSYIENDQCAFIIGHPTLGEMMKSKLFDNNIKTVDPDKYIAMIDLTGRYRLLAEMLTD